MGIRTRSEVKWLDNGPAVLVHCGEESVLQAVIDEGTRTFEPNLEDIEEITRCAILKKAERIFGHSRFPCSASPYSTGNIRRLNSGDYNHDQGSDLIDS